MDDRESISNRDHFILSNSKSVACHDKDDDIVENKENLCIRANVTTINDTNVHWSHCI